uniref:Cytochrome c oxidase subunit NDUFA4 n=1 Tax=Mus spicilegus TaxID=10103 RepID=A0A8C6HZV5_MUSSI
MLYNILTHLRLTHCFLSLQVNTELRGISKKYPRFIPLFLFIGESGTGAARYVMCLALFNSDISWDQKNNLEPWSKLILNEQCKFYQGNVNYSKLKEAQPLR